MDIIAGLTSVGLYFNNHGEKVKYLDYGDILKRTPINGMNIYDSTNYVLNKKYIDDLVDKRYKLSQNPKESGLIPNFYNQLQAVEKRNAEYRKEIMKKEKKQNEIILNEQQTNVESRNVIYKQILYGFVLLMFLLIFIQLTL
jgi:hypothetical protein